MPLVDKSHYELIALLHFDDKAFAKVAVEEGLDFDHPLYEQYDYLFRCEVRDALGSPFACFDALHVCAEFKLNLPKWASERASAIGFDGMSGALAGSRGRAGLPLPRYATTLKKVVQAETVTNIRAWQMNDWGDDPLLRPASVSERLANGEGTIADFRMLGKGYEIAHWELQGTPFQGATSTIKEVYKAVRKASSATLSIETLAKNELAQWVFEYEMMHPRSKDILVHKLKRPDVRISNMAWNSISR